MRGGRRRCCPPSAAEGGSGCDCSRGRPRRRAVAKAFLCVERNCSKYPSLSAANRAASSSVHSDDRDGRRAERKNASIQSSMAYHKTLYTQTILAGADPVGNGCLSDRRPGLSRGGLLRLPRASGRAETGRVIIPHPRPGPRARARPAGSPYCRPLCAVRLAPFATTGACTATRLVAATVISRAA